MQYNAALTRVFKVLHTDEEIEDELKTIVDLGGRVVDIFVWHRAYGRVNAKMSIKSRRDITQLLDDLSSGKSSPLKNITSGYHYHTIEADSEETLEEIENALAQRRYLAPEI